MLRQGTRAQVMHGTALKTTGGLRRNHLKYNKQGKIVSRLLSTKAKKEKRLERAGWTVRKGEFGAVQMKGGGKFIRGRPTRFNNQPSENDLKAHLTPLPEKLISELDDNDYYRDYNGRLNNVFFSVNHYGVVNILEKVYDYYKLGDIPEDLTTKSTRQLIMYLGESPTTFKNKIQGEWKNNEKLKSALNNLEDYTNIASKNEKSNSIRGIKIDSDKYNYSEQTLWKLALYKLERENRRNTLSPSPALQINVPRYNLLDGPLLAKRNPTPQKKSAKAKSAKSAKAKSAKAKSAKAKAAKAAAKAEAESSPVKKRTSNTLRRRKKKKKGIVENGWGNENV